MEGLRPSVTTYICIKTLDRYSSTERTAIAVADPFVGGKRAAAAILFGPSSVKVSCARPAPRPFPVDERVGAPVPAQAGAGRRRGSGGRPYIHRALPEADPLVSRVGGEGETPRPRPRPGAPRRRRL